MSFENEITPIKKSPNKLFLLLIILAHFLLITIKSQDLNTLSWKENNMQNLIKNVSQKQIKIN